MKLLKKYRSYTYFSLSIVIVIGFILDYHLFRDTMHKATDKVIYAYKSDIVRFANYHEDILPLLEIQTRQTIVKIEDSVANMACTEESICDTLIQNHVQNSKIIFRKLVFPVKTQKHNYIVTIMLPTLEKSEIIQMILISLAVLALLFFLLTRFIDIAFTNKIFHPFYKILELIRSYNIEKRTKIQLENNDIDEFRDLSDILTKMMAKINNNYDDMKEFLENTAHELKTPLSIIQLKLENLNQFDIRDKEVIKNLASIQSAIQRITRFNRSLLLIAKINNDQFNIKEKINLNTLLVKILENLQEFIEFKDIELTCHYNSEFMADMNPILAEQLIQNIISNAIKHNCKHGKIEIQTSNDCIIVKNTFLHALPNTNLFKRYTHTPSKSDNHGLGLAIVKNICNKSNLEVSYKIEQKTFSIAIRTKP